MFASETYDSKHIDSGDWKAKHLTSEKRVQEDAKSYLTEMMKDLNESEYDDRELWSSISDLVRKTILSYSPRCNRVYRLL